MTCLSKDNHFIFKKQVGYFSPETKPPNEKETPTQRHRGH